MEQVLPYALKRCLSLLMLLYAVLLLIFRPSTYGAWICAGMVCSALGDWFLSQSPWIAKRISEPFPLGMAAFGLAHLCYWVAFYLKGLNARIWIAFWIGLGLLCTLFWAKWIRMPTAPRWMQFATLGYLWWICAMTAGALAMAMAQGGLFWLVALGGLLFVTSDAIIGVHTLANRFIAHADAWIWATYVPAQLLILSTQLF